MWRLVGLLLCLWPASTVLAERFALAIGNNQGDADEETLRWAEEDARRTHALLIELGDVSAEHATLMLGLNADALRRALETLRARIAKTGPKQDSLLVLYYSGHGSADSLHLAGSHMALAELQALLRSMPVATLVTIIDACRDQPEVRAKGANHSQPFDIRLAREKGPTGRVTITAAGYDEVAQESDKLRSSFFTHHLLSGMRGAADRDGDRQVSLDELYSYAYRNTLASSHAHLAAVQHPQLAEELQGEGDLVITRLHRAQSMLELAPELSGDVMIVDDYSGQVLAELYKPPGTTARVALEAGRFRVQVRNGATTYASEVGLEWGGHAMISSQSLDRQDVSVAQAKGRRLDPKPWLLFAGMFVGTARAAFDAPLLAGGMRASLDIAQVRVFADAKVGSANAEGPSLSHTYLESRLGMGVGPRFGIGPFELFVGVGAGLLHVHESARGDGAELSANALGAYIAPTLSFEVPLPAELLLAVQGDLQFSALRVDEALTLKPSPSGGLLLGRHF